MRDQILIILASVGLLTLAGCGLIGPYEMRGGQMLTLDQALGRAYTTNDLWNLWEQAPPDDKTKIEEVLLDASSKMTTPGRIRTLQTLQSKASSEEIRNIAIDALREHEQAYKEAKQRHEEQRAQARKTSYRKSRL